jgi:hypothetical protein
MLPEEYSYSCKIQATVGKSKKGLTSLLIYALLLLDFKGRGIKKRPQDKLQHNQPNETGGRARKWKTGLSVRLLSIFFVSPSYF